MHCTVRTVGKMCLVLMPGRTRAVSLREEYGFKLPLMTGTKQDYLGAVRPTQRAAGEGPLAHVPRRPGRFQRGGFGCEIQHYHWSFASDHARPRRFSC